MSTHTALQADAVARPCMCPAEIPLLDLRSQFSGIRSEVMEAVGRVLESQHFILGPEVEALEREVAALIGAKFAIGCASGSDALLLAMMALDIGPEDEVITSVFTFGATAGAIARLGARPVFVDIRPETFNLDEDQIEAAITSRTRALMPVHMFGRPANMRAIVALGKKYNLPVIEDAAQAIGARCCDGGVGSLGLCGCFSFFPSKNLGGAGDGGMITTSDPQIADRVRVLRVHGSRRKYSYEQVGMNSRLDALQAAILRVKLPHLPAWNARRRSHAHTYKMLFGALDHALPISLPSFCRTGCEVFNQYTILAPQRDKLQRYLREHGIGTEVYYPTPLHVETAFRFLGYKVGSFPQAEAVCRSVLSLPIYPELTLDQQRKVVSVICDFYQENFGEPAPLYAARKDR